MAVGLREHLKNDADHVHRTTYYVPWTGQQLQKRNKTANINCKKLWFIHELTAHDTSKTAKITKKWYNSTSHWHLGDVLVGNHLFVIFAVLDVSYAVNLCLNRSFCTFISINVTYVVLLSYVTVCESVLQWCNWYASLQYSTSNVLQLNLQDRTVLLSSSSNN